MIQCSRGVYSALRKWLLDHIEQLHCTDEACQYHFDFKRDHSLRVVGEINLLGRALQLSARDLLVAATIAVLHDVGRFEQYKTFRTYNDEASVDHGDLSVRILRSAQVLDAFTSQEQEWIYNAIYWHNKMDLPQGPPDKGSIFARLIRDADKLDIYRVVSMYGPLGKAKAGMPPEPLKADVSSHLYTHLIEGRSVDYNQVKSATDAALARICWVFDLNFQPALRLVAKRNYLEALAMPLPATPKVTEIVDRARQYLLTRTAIIAPAGSPARQDRLQ
jgi:hypothetical protein